MNLFHPEQLQVNSVWTAWTMAPMRRVEHPYLYAAGDPINSSDPSGLLSFSDVLDVGEKVFSAATGCLAGIGAAAEGIGSAPSSNWTRPVSCGL